MLRRMKSTHGHITWSNVDRCLRSMREIWVATATPKGRPDAKPVWWDGEAVYFTCAAVARKARNIAHEPEVVLINGDGADPIIIKAGPNAYPALGARASRQSVCREVRRARDGRARDDLRR